MKRLCFPDFDKQNIIAINYKKPKVKEIINNLDVHCKNNKNMLDATEKIKTGEAFQKILFAKVEGYFDTFKVMPLIDDSEAHSNAIKIMALASANCELNKVVAAAEKEVKSSNAESLKKMNPNDLAAYKKMETTINLISTLKKTKVAEDAALDRFNTLLQKYKQGPLNIDLTSHEGIDFLNSLNSGRGLLIDLLKRPQDQEITEMSIDILYLTTIDDNDFSLYLELLKNPKLEVRAYTYEKAKEKFHLSPKVDLKNPFTDKEIKEILKSK
jgi:hypothetical protein